ncbi:hypothetical protein Q7C36_014314 [Tachysurus vachellii]|uniref:Uncharacterized protein n=1 Tax=Tachysurus vachellii TaxID=175792 RepID=A0AA88SMA6_TACVA|nr:hypothetical protein Q7C36_014314 [Tachysurus vachellii]
MGLSSFSGCDKIILPKLGPSRIASSLDRLVGSIFFSPLDFFLFSVTSLRILSGEGHRFTSWFFMEDVASHLFCGGRCRPVVENLSHPPYCTSHSGLQDVVWCSALLLGGGRRSALSGFAAVCLRTQPRLLTMCFCLCSVSRVCPAFVYSSPSLHTCSLCVHCHAYLTESSVYVVLPRLVSCVVFVFVPVLCILVIKPIYLKLSCVWVCLPPPGCDIQYNT